MNATTENELICRICQEPALRSQLLSPCACKGSIKWVHRDCLDQWRSVGGSERLLKCSICGSNYQFQNNGTAVTNCAKTLHFYFLVAIQVIFRITLLLMIIFINIGIYFLIWIIALILIGGVLNWLIGTSAFQPPSFTVLTNIVVIVTLMYFTLGAISRGIIFLMHLLQRHNENSCVRLIMRLPIASRILLIIVLLPLCLITGIGGLLHDIAAAIIREQDNILYPRVEELVVVDLGGPIEDDIEMGHRLNEPSSDIIHHFTNNNLTTPLNGRGESEEHPLSVVNDLSPALSSPFGMASFRNEDSLEQIELGYHEDDSLLASPMGRSASSYGST